MKQAQKKTEAEEFRAITRCPDLRDFLIKKGRAHRIYCQYTSLDALEGMIKSSKLHLTVGKKMNDLLECSIIDKELWERTYTASFTHTSLESIAMWCVYSKRLSDTLRITFLPSKIWKYTEKNSISRVYQVSKGKYFKYDDIGKPENIFLCDIVYYRKHSICWNGNVSAQNLPDHDFIETLKEQKEMLGLLKHSAWEYEKETRICITLPKTLDNKYPDTIAINFDGLKGASLMSSPCLEPSRLREFLEEQKQKYSNDKKMLKLIQSIRYDAKNASSNHVSSLYDRLYLPSMCEKCKNIHSGCPGEQ